MRTGSGPNGASIDRYQRGPIVTTVVNGRALGDWRAADITRDMIEAFRRQRPTVGNRDLALLRAMFNWAVLGGLVPSTPFKVGHRIGGEAGARERPDTVFGDEVGRRRGSIKTARRLTCQRAKIDGLHFHDLRREVGSRWMDAGVPLATIQRWLGHHNISQTSTYLAGSGGGTWTMQAC